MVKKNGLGATLAVDDGTGTTQATSNDFLNVSVSTPRGVQDITGIDKSAHERLLLLADAMFNYGGVFNDTATTGSHAVLATVPSTSVQRLHTYTVQSKVLACEMMIPDYPLARGADGALTFTIGAQLSSGSVPTWA